MEVTANESFGVDAVIFDLLSTLVQYFYVKVYSTSWTDQIEAWGSPSKHIYQDNKAFRDICVLDTLSPIARQYLAYAIGQQFIQA